MKKKAYSYVRFSTRDQIHGDSLRRQTESAARWCRENKVDLVDSYRDLGMSAFHGKNAEVGALAAFLDLIRNGRIERGSYLIVESLDRVSRSEILDALDLFLSIIKAGVSIVTLSDGHVYDRAKITANFTDLVISLSIMSRAHEESRTKAMRLAAAWDAKRKRADKEKITGKCVAWLRLSGDRSKFEFVPDRASVVRRIFDMARKGHGANGIAKTLRREGVPTFGRSDAWHVSYVKKILDNRAVVGEFTPATRRKGKRVFLDPLPDYYPAVVDKGVFATVQQLRKARPSYKGRSGFNVFSKLAFDRGTGSSMAYVNKARDKGWHYLVPSAALRQQAEYHAWPYDEFLGCFLFVCQNAALQCPPKVAAAENSGLAEARQELDEADKQINRLVDFLAQGESGAVETKLRELEGRKVELKDRIVNLESEARAKPADMSKVDWKDRGALRENLRATVKRITVDAAQKAFRAEFLDGRAYEFAIKDGEVTISTADQAWVGELLKRAHASADKTVVSGDRVKFYAPQPAKGASK